MPRIAGIVRSRARPVLRAAPRVRVPALFGGARGGQKSVYLDEVELGSFGDTTTVGFNASVEQWRTDVENQAGTLPVNFLLMWIQVESNGNPCNLTSLQEAGIFQLMNNDNMANGGTSLAQQHPVPPCIAGQNSVAYRSSLNDDQAYEQVRAGIQYVNFCRKAAESYMAQAGYLGQPGWTDNDWSYWAMVKWIHIAPAHTAMVLQKGIAGAGGIPADYDQMMSFNNEPPNWVDNGRKVGIYGQGGGSVFNKQYIVYGGLAVGALALIYLARKQSRRVAH